MTVGCCCVPCRRRTTPYRRRRFFRLRRRYYSKSGNYYRRYRKAPVKKSTRPTWGEAIKQGIILGLDKGSEIIRNSGYFGFQGK